MLDGQPVAIPARHIRGIKTRQRLRFDDNILENLVDRVADMYIAIGIRRAVMQHKFGAAFADFADFLVKIFFLPGFEHDGLALGEIATHGKRRIRQVKRFFIVSHEI